MARKLTPRLVTAAEAGAILGPISVSAPRLSQPEPAEKLRTRANFADAISRLWRDAEENFLSIGRYLNHAKTVLQHGEFMEMMERDLPFRYSTGNRLMKVAAALDGGELPVERLPPSYAAVYEILTLSPVEREEALSREIIRPDARRGDIIAFKKRARARNLSETEEKRTRLAALVAERGRIDREIAELRRDLGLD